MVLPAPESEFTNPLFAQFAAEMAEMSPEQKDAEKSRIDKKFALERQQFGEELGSKANGVAMVAVGRLGSDGNNILAPNQTYNHVSQTGIIEAAPLEEMLANFVNPNL